jgi:hypothetical protein
MFHVLRTYVAGSAFMLQVFHKQHRRSSQAKASLCAQYGGCKSRYGYRICCNGCTPMLQISIQNVFYFTRMLQVLLSGCCICCSGYIHILQTYVPNAPSALVKSNFHVASVLWADARVWDIGCKCTIQVAFASGEIKALLRGVMYMFLFSVRTLLVRQKQ